MRKSKWTITVVLYDIALLALVLHILHGTVFRNPPREIRNQLSIGMPLVFADNQEYLSEMEDVQVIGNQVYLMYGAMHLVKVYDTNRQYVCTYAISGEEARGARLQMFVHDNALYLCLSNDIYVFEDNVCTAFHAFQEDRSFRDELNKNSLNYRNRKDTSGNRYVLKGQKILRIRPDGTEEVFFSRSPLYVVCDFAFGWFLTAGAIAIIALLSYIAGTAEKIEKEIVCLRG